jgi:hypothetical protein
VELPRASISDGRRLEAHVVEHEEDPLVEGLEPAVDIEAAIDH